MKSQKSLSFFVAFWTGLAIAASMAVYAVLQYLTTPGVTAGELAVTHLWHVLVLVAVIYLLFLAVFRKVILEPLRKVYFHLYGVGTGRLADLQLTTRVNEIQIIVDGVNMMIKRMAQGLDPEALDRARSEMDGLRKVAQGVQSLAPDASEEILEHVAGLERALLTLLRSGGSGREEGS